MIVSLTPTVENNSLNHFVILTFVHFHSPVVVYIYRLLELSMPEHVIYSASIFRSKSRLQTVHLSLYAMSRYLLNKIIFAFFACCNFESIGLVPRDQWCISTSRVTIQRFFYYFQLLLFWILCWINERTINQSINSPVVSIVVALIWL